MNTGRVIIIGAGIGGLATANLLAKAGYHVDIFEKDSKAGGRAGIKKIDGFTFDTGPSWYLMPDVFDHYYSLLGESAAAQLDLVRLSPAYKVFFEKNPPVVITSNLDIDSRTFENIEPGAGHALRHYVTKGEVIYALSLQHFLYSNFERMSDFLKWSVIRRSLTMLRLAATPIHTYVSRYVKDQRLRQILEYPMVFLGTSPFSAPAIYSLMSALDFREGVFYPMGGMYTIIQSLERIGLSLGVTYGYNSPVSKILTKKGFTTGIRLADGTEHDADIVISNADLHFTETSLLDTHDQSYPQKYWNKREAGPSAILLSLGIKGTIPELDHHNLLFVDTWRENFESIYRLKQPPEKASIYICKPSQTDPTVALKGHENLFVLIPLPSGVEMNESTVSSLREAYLKQIEAMTGISIRDRIVTQDVFGPNDFRTQFHAWESTMLGQSHALTQSAFFRTPNKSKKVKNLYYVGGSTTPGIGLPMCLIGAELIYKRLVGDKKGGRITSVGTHSKERI